MDGFEKHIRNNREQFDSHRADRDKMWKHIQAGLNESPKEEPKIIPLWRRGWFMVAASIALVIGLGLTALVSSAPSNEQLAEQTELLEIDVHYENLIAQQVQLLQDSPALTDEEKEEFLQFMIEMDEEYAELKKELGKEIDNEMVLGAIVTHYQKRIEIIQALLNRINNSKNNNNEKGILL